VGQFVDQHEVALAGEGGDQAGIGQVARAEHHAGLRALQPRQPRLEFGQQRVVAGHQPRGAGARAVRVDGGLGGGLDRRVVRQAQIVVAGERQQLAAVALDHGAGGALGGLEAAQQAGGLQALDLVGGVGVETVHHGSCLPPAAEGIGSAPPLGNEGSRHDR
jgi:hypothetical protein